MGLVAAAGTVVVLEAVVVPDHDGSWIWIDRVCWHPVGVVLVALGLVVAAFWLGLHSSRLAAATTVSVVMAVPVLQVTWMLGSSAPEQRFPAPGGRWSAVVDQVPVHLLDDGSHLWIETHEGLRSRRWLAACFDADDPQDDFFAQTWQGPDRDRSRRRPRSRARCDRTTARADRRRGRRDPELRMTLIDPAGVAA